MAMSWSAKVVVVVAATWPAPHQCQLVCVADRSAEVLPRLSLFASELRKESNLRKANF